jgi:hypothetical protein
VLSSSGTEVFIVENGNAVLRRLILSTSLVTSSHTSFTQAAAVAMCAKLPTKEVDLEK